MRFFVILLLAIPFFGFASDAPLNAGFVNGLWFSKTPFFTDETIRIYTVFQNQSGVDITGTIEFLDGINIIAKKDFSAITGQLVQSWADWKVPYGDHSVKVKIIDVMSSTIGSPPKAVNLVSEVSSPISVFVDTDTDGDGVGNKIDTDDDNDEIADASDKSPLIKDKPIEKLDIKSYADNALNILKTSPDVGSTTASIFQKVDSITESIKDKLVESKKEVDKKIESNKKNEINIASSTKEEKESSVAKWSDKDTWQYIKKYFLQFFIFIFSYKLAFYSFVALILYLIWRIFRVI